MLMCVSERERDNGVEEQRGCVYIDGGSGTGWKGQICVGIRWRTTKGKE
jgi:hypothetical protein